MTDIPYETNAVRAAGGGYHAEYRFAGEDWRTVCDNDGPIKFVTRSGASEAASVVARSECIIRDPNSPAA